jgi:hypothetical protein
MIEPSDMQEIVESLTIAEIVLLMTDGHFFLERETLPSQKALLDEAAKRLMALDCKVNLHGLGV